MLMNGSHQAQINECLQELQDTHPIHGLILVSYDGLLLASTFERSAPVERVSALTSAVYLLAGEILQVMAHDDEVESVEVQYKSHSDDHTTDHIVLKPVGTGAILAVIERIPPRYSVPPRWAFWSEIDLAIEYLENLV